MLKKKKKKQNSSVSVSQWKIPQSLILFIRIMKQNRETLASVSSMWVSAKEKERMQMSFT